MKNLLLQIQFGLLVIWYFIIGTPSEVFISPPAEPIELPIPEDIPYRKGKWNMNEILVSLYLKMYNIDDLGLSLKLISLSIGRTEAAMIRKQYRLQDLFDKMPHEEHSYSKADDGVFNWFKNLTREEAELEFLAAMSTITKKIPTGVHKYYKMRYDGALSLRNK